MASINRIQIANFLCEGYTPSKEWNPLYRGQTLSLFGQPSALQIDNGGGKTSLTEACLYLLSKDRRLKSRVEGRVAPVDSGWTHIRIEFVERAQDEDILQSSLIVKDVADIPGVTYVVGMCWSRGKTPNFYYYQGTLEDAPCYIQETDKLTLIDNETFRKSVEGLPGVKWNKWHNRMEWLEEIKQFTNTEVIKQNVEFQLEGAGDYSAMVSKVEQKNGEEFYSAFFRQFIAPELLKNAMGAEGDQDDQRFEDVLLKTLKPTADALVNISRRYKELEDTEQALHKFEPVQDKANEVVDANAAYSNELNALANNAAIVHALAVAAPLPGMPIVPAGTQWASDKRVITALTHMIIDKRRGAAISDEGLAALTGVETRRLNERAGELKLAIVPMDSQAIDLQADLKKYGPTISRAFEPDGQSQPIDNKADLKKERRGGRRYDTKCYELDSALSLLSAVTNFTGAKTAGLDDVLTRAFGIASDEIDTNLYRTRLRKLTTALLTEKGRRDTAEAQYELHQKEHESLIKESRETEENQVAFEVFEARKEGFPEEYWKTPTSARAWAETEANTAQDKLNEHVSLVSGHKGGYELWGRLVERYGLTPLPDALDVLEQKHAAAHKADKDAREELNQAKINLRTEQGNLDREREALATAHKRLSRLDDLGKSLPTYSNIFGNADPTTLDPQTALRETNAALSKNETALQQATSKKGILDGLYPGTRVFHDIFGDTDPAALNPSQALLEHMQSISIEDGIVSEHQPYIEALTCFRDLHPELTPDGWITQTSVQRNAFNGERIENIKKIDGFVGEMADLDAFGAADDRVYAKALLALSAGGIAFDRLHDIASRTVKGSRLEQCLTLFSAALSAPIIESVDVAAEAAEILEREKLTVPIFLKSALEQFLRDGEIHQAGNVSHALWVGRHTRQVAILLNPALIAEEKASIQSNVELLEARNEEIEEALKQISEESEEVKIAINAKEAIRRNSEQTHSDASERRNKLHALTTGLERRASQEAIASIEAMKRYLAAGGDAARAELEKQVIPQLSMDRNAIDSKIQSLNKQVTEEALRALHSVKDYQREGGEDAHSKARDNVEGLNLRVSTLVAQVNVLQKQVEGVLSDRLVQAVNNLTEFNETYSLDKRDLEQSIQFGQSGYVAFMESAAARRTELDKKHTIAQRRLQGIDFDRAEHYIQSTMAEGRSVSERIAAAEAKRIEAKNSMDAAEQEISKLNADIAFVTPLVEAMHEMVVSIHAQHAKLAGFSEDIRSLMRSATGGNPEILDYAETIRLACLGDSPRITQEIRSTMANLKACIDELDIDTSRLFALNKVKTQTQRDFIHRRDEFCDRARKGEISGLSQLEIEEISVASTIEQLDRIGSIKSKIESQIQEMESNLNKLRETMEANKAATIDSLTRFASQATLNLDILDKVMKRTPKARFHIEAPVADDDDIKGIIEFLVDEIESKERTARSRQGIALNDDIDRRESEYKVLIKDTIYKQFFMHLDEKKETLLTPKVYFTHESIRGVDKTPFTYWELSGGQRTALMMMWLIRQVEFASVRDAMHYGSKKERAAALKGSQRIMFFDGLFSNLSNEDYIDDAFQGLKEIGENFQLIGLIHYQYYVNNKDIFPVHLVGKKRWASKGEKRRAFVAVEPWQDENGMIVTTNAYKHKPVRGTLSSDNKGPMNA